MFKIQYLLQNIGGKGAAYEALFIFVIIMELEQKKGKDLVSAAFVFLEYPENGVVLFLSDGESYCVVKHLLAPGHGHERFRSEFA